MVNLIETIKKYSTLAGPIPAERKVATVSICSDDGSINIDERRAFSCMVAAMKELEYKGDVTLVYEWDQETGFHEYYAWSVFKLNTAGCVERIEKHAPQSYEVPGEREIA